MLCLMYPSRPAMRSKIDGLGGHNVPMHLTARHEFSAPCDRVYAMSTDPVFLDQACRDLGALSQTVEVVPGDGATTRVSMVAETVPALRTLAGGTLTIGQELTWGPAVPDGSRTDLGAVAAFVVQPSDREIQRLNRLTTVVINANLAKGTTMDEVRKRVEPVMEAYALPAGYTWKFGRGFEENDKAIQTMSQNMLLAVVLIFLVMASLFESALYPLSIITSIVFAIVGSIWFLTLTGTTITMMAMIGFMVLMGVVVNIGIVLIAHVIDLRHAGLPRHEAILQAGHDRLRPIMMTTLTTLLGMLPLAIGDAQVGGGGEGPAYYPLARAIIGGLAFSAVVSLIIVPVFYVWFDDLNLWRKRVFTRARPADDLPPTSVPQAEPGT